jgi:hypothetical protein
MIQVTCVWRTVSSLTSLNLSAVSLECHFRTAHSLVLQCGHRFHLLTVGDQHQQRFLCAPRPPPPRPPRHNTHLQGPELVFTQLYCRSLSRTFTVSLVSFFIAALLWIRLFGVNISVLRGSLGTCTDKEASCWDVSDMSMFECVRGVPVLKTETVTSTDRMCVLWVRLVVGTGAAAGRLVVSCLLTCVICVIICWLVWCMWLSADLCDLCDCWLVWFMWLSTDLCDLCDCWLVWLSADLCDLCDYLLTCVICVIIC